MGQSSLKKKGQLAGKVLSQGVLEIVFQAARNSSCLWNPHTDKHIQTQAQTEAISVLDVHSSQY